MVSPVLPSHGAFPTLETRERYLRPDDIVHVLYDKKVGKGTYRLGRVLEVHPDAHNVVRTVTVGLKHLDKREAALLYMPRPLERHVLGVQRICVICPVEEQDECDARKSDQLDGDNLNTTKLR